jgi:aspartyl-tRNA(Asn)/glutamyl-tRNA(Gln) amidotransferase subunit A
MAEFETLPSVDEMLRRFALLPPSAHDSHAAALATEFRRRNAQWHCAEHIFAAPSPQPGGLLSGVPLAHKDVFDTGLHVPGLGRPRTTGQIRPAATVLQRLKAQGALHLGALTMAEFACGATAESLHSPRLLNPLDAQAAVGGSSSGSAVAVAAGLCAASLGTDTAGSVRMPAATCALIGLKPTRGLLPSDGVAPLAPTLDTVGVIARSAADAARIFTAMLPTRPDTPEPPPRWRIGNAMRTTREDAGVAAALTLFEKSLHASVQIQNRPAPDLGRLNRLAQIVLHAEAAISLEAAVRTELDTLAPATRAIALPGWAMPNGWYRHALHQIPAQSHAFMTTCLDGIDLLLTPCLPKGVPDRETVTTSCPGFDPRALAAMHRHHAYINYLGLPALVMPVGKDGRGRPVSVQIVGAPGSESLLLAFAHEFALPFHHFVHP